MIDTCCDGRPNFGRPEKICDWGNVVGFVLFPLKRSNGAPFYWEYNEISYETIVAAFLNEEDPEDRIYGFPILENITYSPAESLKEDGSSGRSAFLRSGKITFTGETWDKDAMPVLKGKFADLRCMGVGIAFVTSTNQLIGSNTKRPAFTLGDSPTVFMPIPLDSQSIDPRFMFRLDQTTQKVMISFDLDRNFDDSTYYSIQGDSLWSTAGEKVIPFDFINPPMVIDCDMQVGTVTTTGIELTINDDYRQGARIDGVDAPGNVTGLQVTDFKARNLTDGTNVVITAVSEDETGKYSFTWAAQTAGDQMKVSIIINTAEIVHYNGIAEFQIPA